MKSIYKQSIQFFILFSIVLWLLGCGGSSVENPTQESDENDTTPQVEQTQSLKVNVDVSKATVKTGETVQMTATVDAIRGTRILLNWVNVTEFGKLSVTNQNSVTWIAPQTLDNVEVRVEVIQLIVTAISQIVSVKESGVHTDTEVLTTSKTILLTVTAN